MQYDKITQKNTKININGSVNKNGKVTRKATTIMNKNETVQRGNAKN